MRDHCHAPTEKRKNSTGQKSVLEDLRSLCDHCGRHDHAGCLDYKNGLLPGSLWLVGMILWTDRTISAGDTEDNPEK